MPLIFLNLFYHFLQFLIILTLLMIILETFGLWDIHYNSDNWEPDFMIIFVTWHWTTFAILAMFCYHRELIKLSILSSECLILSLYKLDSLILWNIILSHRCLDIFCNFEVPKDEKDPKDQKRQFDCCKCVKELNSKMDTRKEKVNAEQRKKYPNRTLEANTIFNDPIKPITCPWGELWYWTPDPNF